MLISFLFEKLQKNNVETSYSLKLAKLNGYLHVRNYRFKHPNNAKELMATFFLPFGKI